MPQTSVKDQIRKLIELQKLDLEIYTLEKDIKEKPLLIDQLKQEFEASKEHLNNLESKLKSALVGRKELELELKSKEDEIAKSNSQLSQIKTNKEYTAKLSEIESIKADKSLSEEKILLSYDQTDAMTKEIATERSVVSEKEKGFLSKKKEVEDQVKIQQDRVVVLKSQRKQISPDLDKSLLSRYDTILQHKEGLALVPVKGAVCGGCFMSITQQMMNALRLHEKLVECEMCSRILYLEDDL